MEKNRGLIAIFEYALNQERTGCHFFEQSLIRLGNRGARSAFLKLIEEEKRHIEMIERILKGLREGPVMEKPLSQPLRLPKRSFFDSRAKEALVKRVAERPDLVDAAIFNTAWLIEKDLIRFYGEAALQAEGEIRKALEMLCRWEESHALFFEDFRNRLTSLFAKIY